MRVNNLSIELVGDVPEDNQLWTSISMFCEPRPSKVYFNGKYTIVEWSDGVKTKAGLHAEEFDEEKGIAMAIARRFLGRGQFERLLENADDQR
jgi:hypothetical protein